MLRNFRGRPEGGGRGQNLTSGQGHLRSRRDLDRSWCISVDASRQEKHIGTNRTALSLFYQKLEEKMHLTSNDLEWREWEVIGSNLHMGHRN